MHRRSPGRPSEDWDGPWAFLERTQAYRVFDATLRVAEMIGQLLDADDRQDWDSVGVCRDELAVLAPLLGLERFDRRACNTALTTRVATAAGVSRA